MVHHGNTIICTTAASHVCPCSVNRTWSVHVSCYRWHGRVKRLNSCFCFVLKKYTHDDGMNIIFFSSWTMRTGRHVHSTFYASTKVQGNLSVTIMRTQRKWTRIHGLETKTSRNKGQKKKTSLALNKLADFLKSTWT